MKKQAKKRCNCIPKLADNKSETFAKNKHERKKPFDGLGLMKLVSSALVPKKEENRNDNG